MSDILLYHQDSLSFTSASCYSICVVQSSTRFLWQLWGLKWKSSRPHSLLETCLLDFCDRLNCQSGKNYLVFLEVIEELKLFNHFALQIHVFLKHSMFCFQTIWSLSRGKWWYYKLDLYTQYSIKNVDSRMLKTKKQSRWEWTGHFSDAFMVSWFWIHLHCKIKCIILHKNTVTKALRLPHLHIDLWAKH